jgi:hypothetical protein
VGSMLRICRVAASQEPSHARAIATNSTKAPRVHG